MKSPNDITQYKIFEGHRTKPRPKNRSESTIVFARPRNAYSKQQSMVDCIFTDNMPKVQIVKTKLLVAVAVRPASKVTILPF